MAVHIKCLLRFTLWTVLVSVLLVQLLCYFFSWDVSRLLARVGVLQMLGYQTSIAERVQTFAEPVRARLQPLCEKQGLEYPPQQMRLLAFKQERKMELWLADQRQQFHLVKTYPILGASGTLGPKLREGDRQVPEGFYTVESLNPNSRFHLSLRLNYPNTFDQQMAAADGRSNIGSDIMIHGDNASIGCLAMGDPAAEELFILATLVGCKQIKVIIAAYDFRGSDKDESKQQSLAASQNQHPTWYPQLCTDIKHALRDYCKTTDNRNK